MAISSMKLQSYERQKASRKVEAMPKYTVTTVKSPLGTDYYASLMGKHVKWVDLDNPQAKKSEAQAKCDRLNQQAKSKRVK
jgi:hypothetical protein